MPATDNNYVIGRGRLNFDQFAQGTKTPGGELYFGNTPSLSMTSSTTSMEHFSSEHGLNEKDASVDIQKSRSGKFTTDNISIPNLALYFAGTSEPVTTVADTDIVTAIPAAKLGRWYQLGVTALTPQGVQKVTNIVITKGVTPVAALNNFEYDLALGRVYIEPDAPGVVDGDALTVTFDVEASTQNLVIAKNQVIYGSLRFISDNATGENRDYFWPYVKISSDGDYSLKGDSWQEMSFTFEVLKLNEATSAVYITDRAA